MSRFLILSCLLIITMITSCEFVPDEVPDSNIEKPGNAPPMEFNLNNIKDTIKIGWTTDFTYSVNNGNKILSVKISFGDERLVNYEKGNNDQSFIFTLTPRLYDNGNYLLHIEIITGTGTGSIADNLDAEGYIYTLDWPVLIDKTLPGITGCSINATQTRKAVNLSWTAFNHANFRSYSIFRGTQMIKEITDPLITTYSDTTFWEGESNRYYLSILTPAGRYDGDMVSVRDSITGVQAEWRRNGTVYVSWDKADNIYTLAGYEVSSYFNTTSINEEHFISDPDQNYVILENPGFAYRLQIKVKFIPKDLDEIYYGQVHGKTILFYSPPVLPAHNRSYPVNGSDFLLLATTGKVFRYHPSEMNVSDSLVTRLPKQDMLTVSNDGRIFAYTDFSNIYVRRTDDFVCESQFTSPALVKPTTENPDFENLAFISISDNGRLVVGEFDGLTWFYDALSGTLIAQDTILIDGGTISNGILSPDGTRLLANKEYSWACILASFELDAGEWKETSRTIAFFNPFYFWSADGSSLYLAGNFQIQKMSSDLALISGFTKTYSSLEGADVNNETILYQLNGNLVFYDLNTGQEIRTLPYGDAGTIQPFKKYLISNRGYQLTIPE